MEPDAEAVYHRTVNGVILRRSYAVLADRARGLAYYLKKHNFSNKHVGILCPNTPACLESIFGIAAAGAVNVAVNYRLSAQDISYILIDADVEAVIVDVQFLPLLSTFHEQRPSVPFIVDTDTDALSGPFNEAILEGLDYEHQQGSHGWAGLEVQAANEQDTIAICYTSGTTARPKGVEYTHRACYLHALAGIIETGLRTRQEGCRFLWTLPIFHGVGWSYPWAVTAVHGTHYCLRKIDYPEIWRLLKEEHITHFVAAPTVNMLLCNAKERQRLDHPVHVVVGGAPPPAQLFEQMESLNLQPLHAYGSTETGAFSIFPRSPWGASLPPKESHTLIARQGYGRTTSLPCRVIKTGVPEGTIVDVAKDGKEIGEVVLSGNICGKGYYKNEEATKKLFAGGWSHSGDLAVWHDDGSVRIVDRMKDLIISGGENISSVAVETKLMENPNVLEAAVVAVSDPTWGERPKAFITIKAENPVPDGKELKGDDVIEWLKRDGGLSRFMVPKEVEIVQELPKTATGKLQKFILREWAGGESKETKNEGEEILRLSNGTANPHATTEQAGQEDLSLSKGTTAIHPSIEEAGQENSDLSNDTPVVHLTLEGTGNGTLGLTNGSTLAGPTTDEAGDGDLRSSNGTTDSDPTMGKLGEGDQPAPHPPIQ